MSRLYLIVSNPASRQPRSRRLARALHALDHANAALRLRLVDAGPDRAPRLAAVGDTLAEVRRVIAQIMQEDEAP